MTLLPPSVADERFLILEQLTERLQSLNHDTILKIYYPQIVDQTALIHLADQLNVAGVRGWNLADTEARQRALIENAIELNRRSGTAYAILTAMESVGYPNATVTENPDLLYDGSWSYNGEEIYAGKRLAGFIVSLDPEQSDVNSDRVQLLIDMINEWKNARSALLDLRIGDISLLQNLLLYDGTWSYDGGQEYDGEKDIYGSQPELQNYENRVIGAGGALTAAQRAIVQTFLYTAYDDGAAGTATVASFISAFEGADSGIYPLFGDDLAAALIPLVGNDFQPLVNSGFIEGDYSTAGLQGDGSSYLDLNIDAANINVASHYLAIAATLATSGSSEFLIRSTPDGYRLLENAGGSLVGRLNGTTAVGVISGSSNIYSMNAPSINELSLYEGLAEIDLETTSRTPITGVLSLFGRASIGTHLIKMVVVSNRALTDAERNVMHNAITAYIAARDAL